MFILEDKLADEENKVAQEEAKLKAVAFAVHPEYEYGEFRKKAYIEVFQKVFPDASFDKHDMVLVRVFNASSFMNADPVFSLIQNDDIILYDSQLAANSQKVPVIIVRPREQRVLVQELISTNSLSVARSGNKSLGIFGPTPNYFSQQ